MSISSQVWLRLSLTLGVGVTLTLGVGVTLTLGVGVTLTLRLGVALALRVRLALTLTKCAAALEHLAAFHFRAITEERDREGAKQQLQLHLSREPRLFSASLEVGVGGVEA